jgi:uncharacterized protein YjiS (DUF1127 family)
MMSSTQTNSATTGFRPHSAAGAGQNAFRSGHAAVAVAPEINRTLAPLANLRGETLQPLHPRPAAIRPAVRGLLALPRLLATWHKRWEQRQAMRDLSEHMLRDMGISRYDALREAAKPFWMR